MQKKLIHINIYPFLIESLSELGIVGNFFNLGKDLYQKLASDSMVFCKTVNPIPLNQQQDAFNHGLIFSPVLRVLSGTTSQEKERKLIVGPLKTQSSYSKFSCLHPMSSDMYPYFF